jgi:hypothetical protein
VERLLDHAGIAVSSGPLVKVLAPSFGARCAPPRRPSGSPAKGRTRPQPVVIIIGASCGRVVMRFG